VANDSRAVFAGGLCGVAVAVEYGGCSVLGHTIPKALDRTKLPRSIEGLSLSRSGSATGRRSRLR
jgi:hypothetical protein